MKERLITLPKDEFDQIEQELKALQETVKSKTITAIIKRNWADCENYYSGMDLLHVGTRVEFITGTDENKIIEDLSEEVKNLRNLSEVFKKRMHQQNIDFLNLRDEKIKNESWKDLPWWKRLFPE
jgi:hypothetical protein